MTEDPKPKIASTSHKWGVEILWASTPQYSGRVLIVKEGERTPYIYHKSRDKTLFILQGVVQLVVEGKNRILNEGEQFHINPKIMHRIHAFKGDATILEAGTELVDDVVVVEDDYSKAK